MYGPGTRSNHAACPRKRPIPQRANQFGYLFNSALGQSMSMKSVVQSVSCSSEQLSVVADKGQRAGLVGID